MKQNAFRVGAKSRLRFQIKEISESGTFEGILSPYGNVDGGGDVVEKGAYTKTLKERGNKVPLLWQHKSDTPIGELLLDDREDGLWCKGQLMMDDPAAQKAYLYIKAGIVKGLSIGFESIKDAVLKSVRYLKEIKLYEGSIVTFPMNEMAMITDVKSREEKDAGDFNTEMEEIQTINAFYDMRSALSSALSSVVWSDLERDEKIAAGTMIVQQFSDFFAEFWPNYIDMMVQVYGPSEMWSAKLPEIKARIEKAGAEFSSANIEKIKAACEKLLEAHGSLSALVESKAGTTTLEEKAAEAQPEPVDDHSASEAINQMLLKVNATLSPK